MKMNMDLKGLGRKLGKIPRIFKVLFILLVHGAVFAAFFYVLIVPQMETKDKLLSEYEEIRRNLDKMVAIKNNMPKFRKEYEEMQQVLSQALTQLPDTKDIPNLLRNVSSLGTETMIRVRYFEPKSLQTREFYSELPFEIRYTGPFHNLAYFFDGIRRLDRIINITNFSLEVPPRGDPAKVVLQGQCTARTYVYLKDRPKTKKEVKKEAKGGTPAKK